MEISLEHIYATESPRQYYRCGVALEDQLVFYKSVIVSITEYDCPSWHTSLNET